MELSINIPARASDGAFPIDGIRAFLQPDSHLKIKKVRIFVPAGGHLGDDGGAVKIGPLKPMIVADIKVHIGADRPLRTKFHIMPQIVSRPSGGVL